MTHDEKTGMRAALVVALLLSCAAAAYFFVEPIHSFRVATGGLRGQVGKHLIGFRVPGRVFSMGVHQQVCINSDHDPRPS